jgi:hypothetical protein
MGPNRSLGSHPVDHKTIDKDGAPRSSPGLSIQEVEVRWCRHLVERTGPIFRGSGQARPETLSVWRRLPRLPWGAPSLSPVCGDRVGSASRRLTCNGDPSGLRRLAVFCDSISMTSFTLVVGSIPPCPFKQRRDKDGAPRANSHFGVFHPVDPKRGSTRMGHPRFRKHSRLLGLCNPPCRS